jgi:hypothetical protein
MDWLINQNDQNKKEVTLLRKFVSSSRTTQESILQRYFGASTENQKLELH